jgi:uncharacterized protein
VKFWDASAIVPLCLTEPRTPALSRIADDDGAIAAWWTTPVECVSALTRLRRERALTPSDERRAHDLLDRLAAEWTEIAPSTRVRQTAGRLLSRHPLRVANSLQLAAALLWADGNAAGREFVCLDERLREAAEREGFAILPGAR